MSGPNRSEDRRLGIGSPRRIGYSHWQPLYTRGNSNSGVVSAVDREITYGQTSFIHRQMRPSTVTVEELVNPRRGYRHESLNLTPKDWICNTTNVFMPIVES